MEFTWKLHGNYMESTWSLLARYLEVSLDDKVSIMKKNWVCRKRLVMI
ncbi:hypothetical protein [Chitinophaga skermanii]|nr:hypothetical protein [Chitinophaga skermanii]